MNNTEERYKLLEDAANTIINDRVNQYGQPEDCFEYIANLWSIYIEEKYGFEKKIKSIDVANMMALLKIARMTDSASIYKRDNYIDAIGYLAIANSFEAKEDNNGQ